jgi:hypothetical protein
MSSPEEKELAAKKLEEVARLEREGESAEKVVEESLDIELPEGELKSFFDSIGIVDEHETVSKLAEYLNVQPTHAKKYFTFPNEYVIQDHSVPDIIKTMRRHRRKLKGEHRGKMNKAIDTLIEGYSDHLNKCIDSIYWLNEYKPAFKKMRFNEKDLQKLYEIKSADKRRDVIDSLCKYWEAELEQEGMPYGKSYSKLHKTMSLAKREFRQCISKKAIRKSLKEDTKDFIMKMVCEEGGIGARQIFDRMPDKLHKRCSPNMVSKLVKSLNITDVDGAYYKFSNDIKKNVWAYTAAFIDSDGYITVDRSMNPRVGLVATGDRGKAFMLEIQKSLGLGKLHLDQKSPQNTRPVNRLNFYSQDDITKLLTKCRPHFRMKGKNADLLLELIKMKRGYKKAPWYKERCGEIFKLMKWENHRDHVGYDFTKEGIDIETITKLHDNCKMNLMNEMENIQTPMLKA